MSALDYELFRAIKRVTRVTADKFEVLLMVDADTKVADDSLSLMMNAMANNQEMMGCCGEFLHDGPISFSLAHSR